MSEGSTAGRAWLVPVLVCIVTGALVGVALGVATSGADDTEPGGTSAVDAATAVRFFHCPDVGPLDAFHAEDRVYLTARDDTGDWVQVREPYDLAARVWIPTAAVLPDGSIDALPVEPCTWEPPPPLEELTPPAEPPPGTETTDPDVPGPLGPEPTPPEPRPTEPEPEPTPPTEVDRPTIEAIVAEPAEIWELGCIDPVSQVRAVVRGDVRAVTLSWSVGAERGSTPMRVEGGDWVAEVGDFPPRTVDPSGPGVEPITLTVDAVGPSGARATETTTEALRLRLCD